MPSVATQAAFARMIGVNRSHVTRLKQHGRLAMTLDGLVEVEASIARIRDTAGMRFDVAERHAQTRQNGAGAAQISGEGEGQGGGRRGGAGGGAAAGWPENRADAQARKESVAADLLEIELAQKRGSLLPQDAVDLALKALGGAVRAQMAMYADRVAPLVAPVISQDEVHALIDEACRGVLAAVADELTRQEAALRAEAAQ